MTNDLCKFCKAPILWATSDEGRPIPLDPDPGPGGNIDVIDDVVHVLPLGAERPTGDRYVNHFATCQGAQRLVREQEEEGE